MIRVNVVQGMVMVVEIKAQKKKVVVVLIIPERVHSLVLLRNELVAFLEGQVQVWH